MNTPPNGNYNGKGSGDGHDPDEDDNIIRMPTLAERDKMRREAEELEKAQQQAQTSGHREQFINLPPVTKYLLGVFVALHVVLYLLVPDNILEWTVINFGFIPGSFTGALPFEALDLLTPVSYMFLHGSWLHLAMNSVMMMAFGSGIEKWIGGRRMFVFFILCSLCGIATHFALHPFSPFPVIGASGGLSGFFAAVLIMLNRPQNAASTLPGGIGQGRYGLWPFIILWIGISVLFGMMGSPDGSSVAWAAHVGGFLGGFLVLRLMRI